MKAKSTPFWSAREKQAAPDGARKVSSRLVTTAAVGGQSRPANKAISYVGPASTGTKPSAPSTATMIRAPIRRARLISRSA
jgi:hypothetical protein